MTDSGFTILKRDNTFFHVFLIILTIITAPAILGNVILLNWSAISIATTCISLTNIANLFIIHITIFHNRKTILKVLETILLTDEDLCRTDYKYTRRYIVQMFSIYGGMFVVLFVSDVVYTIYQNLSAVALTYIFYSYIFYLIHMSSSLPIFLLLKEISVRFYSTNAFCRSLRRNNVTAVIKLHRRLCELSKTVVAVLEVIMLGKLLSASGSSLYALLEIRRRLEEAESIEDYAEIMPTVMWGGVQVWEMVALVYHFCDIRYEVSAI